MIAAVEKDKQRDAKGYKSKANAKLLKAIYEIALNRIPQDPTDKRYRLGSTLGKEYTHWFSDSFGAARYRIFFRYDMNAKVIVYAWVNDSNTLRTYGSSTDAYAVFQSMLDSGNPPDSFQKLLEACQEPENVAKTLRAMGQK